MAVVPNPVVAVLNAPSLEAPPHEEGAPAVRLVEPRSPIIEPMDFGVTRGDGVFETISVGGGRPQALEPHLARLQRSAAMLELPAPDLSAGWR